MKKLQFRFLDGGYVLRFLLLLLFFYGGNNLFIGLTVPGGAYSPFVDRYLDYPSWLGASIIHMSRLMTLVIGLDPLVINGQSLVLPNEAAVTIGWPCLGLGVMSFWAAFIMAQLRGWKHTFLWCVAGCGAIWLINCMRIALLLPALRSGWNVDRFMDVHELFSYACYLLILGMAFLYHKRSKKPAPELPEAVAGA